VASRFAVEEDEWPPYQPKHYTTLALIHHKDKPTDTKVLSVTRQLAIEGNLSQINFHAHQKEVLSNTTKI